MGLLLVDCWLCISLAMSMGFVSMLLFASVIQSNGDVSWFLKTRLLIFWDFCHRVQIWLRYGFLNAILGVIGGDFTGIFMCGFGNLGYG